MKRGYHFRRVTPRMRAAAARMDALAEHVSNEGTVAGFARDQGITERAAQMVWRKIREGLGEQAA